MSIIIIDTIKEKKERKKQSKNTIIIIESQQEITHTHTYTKKNIYI